MPIGEITALLKDIPSSFWGVLFGGGFTLAGVILSNRAQDNRLRKQFDHERTVKNIDREMTLRKEIFLAAAEVVAEAVNSLMRMSDLQIPNQKVSERYIEKSPALAKIHAVAKVATAKAFIDFATAYSGANLRLFARRAPLIWEGQSLQWISADIDATGKERDRWLEHMKQFNLEGGGDRRRWDVISGNFEFNSKRVEEKIQERIALQRGLNERHMTFSAACMDEVQALGAALLPIIVEVRRELEIPLDAEAYAQIVASGQRAQRKMFQDFIVEMKALQKPT